jgi:anti-sigma factor RsiW
MTAHDLDAMDPQTRRELLVAYLDGELPAEQALGVTAWLDDHPEALRDVEHLRHAWDLLDHYEDEPVPPDFAPRVLQAVGITPAQRAGRVVRMAWYRRPLATAAAVLVAVGATVFVMSSREPEGGLRTQPPTDVVSVLRDVPPEDLGDLLLNADVLLSVDDAALEGDYSDESLLGG